MARALLKPHATVFESVSRLLDPACSVAAGVIAYMAYRPAGGSGEHYSIPLIAGALAIAVVFPAFRLYDTHRGTGLADELRELALAWLVIAAMTAIVLFATKTGQSFSRVWVALWLAFGFTLSAAMRVATRLVLRRWRSAGRNLRHVAIVGAGALGERVAHELARASWTGFNVVAFYDDDAARHGTERAGKPVLGPAERLLEDIDALGIDQVWIALPLRAEARMRAILTLLRNSAIDIRFVPDIFGFHLLNHSFTEVAGLPVLSLTESPMTGFARIAKRVEDSVLGLALVIVASPLMVMIAIGIRLSSPGPVLYRQIRMTVNGDSFTMLKFRTMPIAAESDSGAVWSRHGEQRATALGMLLRRFSLDELPQLINVMRGDMSLVGPRPERPEFVARFRDEIPGYMQKHLVKAGITGWAQVNDLRGDSDLARRIQYDLYYIDHWSLWFDLRILALTIWHILTSRNAH